MNRASRWVAAAVLAVMAGCGGDGNSVRIPVVPAKGTVSVAGKPVAAGIVVLQPVPEGGSEFQASGEIKDGAFELMSRSDLPGAVPGKYRVKLEAEDEGTKSKGKTKSKVKSAEEVVVEVKAGEDLAIDLP